METANFCNSTFNQIPKQIKPELYTVLYTVWIKMIKL